MKARFQQGWGWVRDNIVPRHPSWRTASVLGVVIVLAVAAVVVEGYRSAKLELDEASVWVTSSSRAMAGRINTLAGRLEVGTDTIGKNIDVFQRGRDVVVVNAGSGPGSSLGTLDAATGSRQASLELKPDISVSAGAGRVALLSSKNGRLWVADSNHVDRVNFKSKKGTDTVAADSVIVIGPSGDIYAFSAGKKKIERVTEDKSERVPTPLQVGTGADDLEVNVIGTTPVVLSTSQGKLQIGDRVVDLSKYGTGPRLQDGPGSGESVLVATDSVLVSVPLSAGDPEVLFESETDGPTRPVSAAGCQYGAWVGTNIAVSSPPLIARVCGKSTASKPLDIPVGSSTKFRVNGSYVILNELDDGKSFLLRDNTLVVIDNWSEVEVPDDPTTSPSTTPNQNGEQKCNPDGENTPPEPRNDEFGARLGRATVLDVLANDLDADCDVLAIESISDIEPKGSAAIVKVDRGHALQFTSLGDYVGPVSFSYTVGDGRSEPTEAAVVVTVKKETDDNKAPEQVRDQLITVGKGQTVSVNVLGSFLDADGDAIVLQSADLPQEALGTVKTDPGGMVTFTDAGSSGKFDIALRVSDGREGSLGKLAVEMVAEPAIVARNDHALGLVNQQVVVDVTANDTGIPGQDLMLAKADIEDQNASVQTDSTAGLVMFTAAKPGSYRVPYSIASGAQVASAFVRFDISEPKSNVPPVAVVDVATVVVGGTTTVDLVSNDYDENLDVLVVTSVDVPSGTGLTAQLLEHRALRLSASRLPDTQPVMIRYTLSDGNSDPVEGQLLVQVVTTGQVNQPPTARDDVAVVRTGDVVTVPVLVNDIDPDGDPLFVVPNKIKLNTADGATAPGIAFGTTAAVRFVAGNEAGNVTISYDVEDRVSGSASALVRVRIVPRGANQAPAPRSVDARTTAGSEGITIKVPTFGIDPDGDAVTLAIVSAATLGKIEASPDEGCEACFVYTPTPGATGTDVISYTATDPGGLSGTATIRVGIGARTGANQPPVAMADRVSIRPGKQVAVPVLSNDFDSDGEPLSLVDEPIPNDSGVSAKVVGDQVLVEGSTEATAVFTYRVTDGKETTPGSLTVEVSTKAPPVPPRARDDVAKLDKGKKNTVEVPVLVNDDDPDGSVDDLTIEVDPISAKIAKVDGRQVLVTLGDEPAVVLYKITDKDQLSAMAVIRVPSATANLAPVLKGVKPISIGGAETVEVKLSDVVEDPEGSKVFLVADGDLTAQHGTVSPTGPDSFSFLADQDYTGPGVVTVTVTDGADPTDATGARATLPIEFAIHSTKNTPPKLNGAAATVEVAGDITTIDLRSFAEDPDEGDLERLKFADLGQALDGVTAELNGSSLVLKADKNAKKGTKFTLNLTVSDEKDPPVPAAVEVSVVGSRKPLATLIEQDIIAVSGTAKEVKVLEGSRVADGLGPLKVLTAKLDSNLGSAEVSSDGQSVVLTPGDSFNGVAKVVFTVTDIPDDPDRVVTGNINVTVKDRPEKPQPPTVGEFGHEFVVLAWQSPNPRGGVIDKYEIQSSDGSVKKTCESTTCKLGKSDGVKNNIEYKFTVRAHNEVKERSDGWSEPSELSTTVRPDTIPDPSTVAPTLKYESTLRSGELKISWPAAASTGPWINQGSPVVKYQIELTPPPPSGATAQLEQGPTVTSFVLTGLIDGQEYQARIRAKNDAGKEAGGEEAGWSQYSPVSVKESPASKSTSPVAVTAKRQDSPIASVIDVSWSRPAKINAKELLSYTIQVYKNGVKSAEIPAVQSPSLPSFSQSIPADDSLGTDFKFRIVATNKAGPSEPSAESPTVRSFQKPKPISGLVATATGVNNQVRLTFSPPNSSGQSIPDTDYRVTVTPGGASFKTYSNGGITIAGLTNGQSYSFVVSACNQGQSRIDYCGDSSNSVSAVPFGPPGNPSVSASLPGGPVIRYGWKAPGPNGKPIDSVEISIDGGSWQAVKLNDQRDVGYGYSERHCFRARAVSGGLYSGEPEACNTTPKPPPTNQVNKAQGVANESATGTCPARGCSKVIAQLRDWEPWSTHTVTAHFGANGTDLCTSYGPSLRTVQVDASGNADVDTGCYAGNRNVGIIVDGRSYVFGWVNWQR